MVATAQLTARQKARPGKRDQLLLRQKWMEFRAHKDQKRSGLQDWVCKRFLPNAAMQTDKERELSTQDSGSRQLVTMVNLGISAETCVGYLAAAVDCPRPSPGPGPDLTDDPAMNEHDGGVLGAVPGRRLRGSIPPVTDRWWALENSSASLLHSHVGHVVCLNL